MFTVEVGRASASGPGSFCFKSHEGYKITDAVDRNRAAVSRKKKDRELTGRPLLPIPPASAQSGHEGAYSSPYGHIPSLTQRWGVVPEYGNLPSNTADLQANESEIKCSIDRLHLDGKLKAGPDYADMTGKKGTTDFSGYVEIIENEPKVQK